MTFRPVEITANSWLLRSLHILGDRCQVNDTGSFAEYMHWKGCQKVEK